MGEAPIQDWAGKFGGVVGKTTGFTFQKLYGVRIVCDYISDNDIKQDPEEYQKLEALEMTLRN